MKNRSVGRENNCGCELRRAPVAEQLDRGCVIRRSVRDAQVLALVLCCSDLQVRTSFARPDHLGGGRGRGRLWARPPVLSPRSKVASLPVLSLVWRKKNKSRSLSSITVSSIVEVTIDNKRSASGSAALELRRSDAPSAPEKTTLHKSNVHNMRRAKPEQQWV